MVLRQRRGKEKGKSRVTLRAHERGKQDRSDRANRPVCPETSAPPSVGAAAGRLLPAQFWPQSRVTSRTLVISVHATQSETKTTEASWTI